MSAKQYIVLGKLWVLLLLSNGAFAYNVLPFDPVPCSKAVSVFETEDTLHKEGLQPQIPSVRIISEHQAKPIVLGYNAIYYEVRVGLALGYAGTTQVLLQDANRCESVSRFLFPYHFFW